MIAAQATQYSFSFEKCHHGQAHIRLGQAYYYAHKASYARLLRTRPSGVATAPQSSVMN